MLMLCIYTCHNSHYHTFYSQSYTNPYYQPFLKVLQCSSLVLHLLHGLTTTTSVQFVSTNGINWTTYNNFLVNHHFNCCNINSSLQGTTHFGLTSPHSSCNSSWQTGCSVWISGRFWKHEAKWYWSHGGIKKTRLRKLLSETLWSNLHISVQGVLEICRLRWPLHRLTRSGGEDGYYWEIYRKTSEYGEGRGKKNLQHQP